MSCDLIRKMRCSKKTNTIILNVATNNIRPLYFENWEYLSKKTEWSYRDKQIIMMKDFLDGNLHVCQVNSSTLPYLYALIKVKEFVHSKGKDLYEDYYKKCGSELHDIFTVYGELYPVWQAALEEKDIQDCILASNNNYKWIYSVGKFDYRAYYYHCRSCFNRNHAKKMSYKKAYIVKYCLNDGWRIEKF